MALSKVLDRYSLPILPIGVTRSQRNSTIQGSSTQRNGSRSSESAFKREEAYESLSVAWKSFRMFLFSAHGLCHRCGSCAGDSKGRCPGWQTYSSLHDGGSDPHAGVDPA